MPRRRNRYDKSVKEQVTDYNKMLIMELNDEIVMLRKRISERDETIAFLKNFS
jgi:hypothetical protein